MPFRFLASALFCLSLVATASARELTTTERQALPGALGSFRDALAAQDVVTVMSFIPPPVAEGMAEHMGMTVPDMVRALADRTAESGDLVSVRSVALDLDAAEALEAGGEPYLLIPTEIVVTFPEAGTIRERSHTLAFPEQGEWRLLRLGDDEGRTLLKVVYPRFSDVDLPESTVEKLAP